MTYNLIFPQVPAQILLTLSVIVLCLIIHIINCINTRNAFTCIEYNTVANIYVKKEIDNQVCDHQLNTIIKIGGYLGAAVRLHLPSKNSPGNTSGYVLTFNKWYKIKQS